METETVKRNVSIELGSATVSVAAIGVPPMAFAGRMPNQVVSCTELPAGRRDADQCARDARAPQQTLSFSIKRIASIVTLFCGCFIVGGEPAFQVPPGFVIERVAGPPNLSFPMFATLDNKGRLYVTESSGGDLYDELEKLVRNCRISVLEDRDGDGRYELPRVFADKLTPSMGLAWHDGKLYAADPPDLVTLEDSDGDGRADKRTVILTGFGHSDNGSLHGLMFGPDGWLYFTMGHPDGYDLHGPDGSRARRNRRVDSLPARWFGRRNSRARLREPD